MSRDCVCIFRQDDGRLPEERLMAAAGLYRASAEVMETEAALERAREEGGWSLLRGRRGKPYFPLKPRTHISISHSGAFWACAVFSGEVGLDLQEHTRLKDETPEEAAARLGRMADRFFHPREAAYVREDPYERFFQVWSAKESYVKYTGQGIDGEFERICVLPEGQGTEDLPAGWEALGVWFRETAYPEGFTLCLCMEKPSPWALFTCTGPAFRRQSIF